MRICFLGDSFVNGTGDDDCLGWTGRICSSARRSGRDVTHYNLGVRRDTTADILARWRKPNGAMSPDPGGRLVFAFGSNDCVADCAGSVRIARDKALDNAHSILSEASKWLPTLMIGPAPVSFDAAADDRIAALSEELGRVCAGIGIPYLPVFTALATSGIWSQEAARGDGTHPNSGGYAEFAAIVRQWSAWTS
jgi:acyl-CoA thioesterase-1